MNLRRGTRPVTPAAALAAGLLALAAGLSGCGSTGEDTAEDPRTTAGAHTGGNPGENKAAAPETGQAADSRPTQTTAPAAPDVPAALESELGKLADSDSFRDPAAVVQAFVTVGFPESAVEVSPDRTPTGLEVDSIQAAAVQDGECVFGEVREGSASVTVLPVLSDGRCFVGD